MNNGSKAKKLLLSSILLIVGLCALLGGEAYFGYRVYQLSGERQRIKEDYSVSNNITFGVFSIDQWREKIASVVDSKVNGFSMTKEQKKEMTAKVEAQLTQLVNSTVKEINKPQKSIGGKLKKLAFNAFVDVDDIQEQVPSFASTIVNKINSPSSMKRLKSIATSKMDQLERQTFDNTKPASATVNEHIYKEYQVSNSAQFDKVINSRLSATRSLMHQNAYLMGGCVIVALGLWFLMRNETNLYTPLFILSLLFAFVLLLVGVTATIIEVDARIESLNFQLLGERLSFNNQVLFFQSQSILSIVTVLLSQPKPDSVLVGTLILLFVMILPVLRLIGKGIHVCGKEKLAGSKFVKFLAFDLGKWDMADVMIVGIAMTYIGLNGILKSQLSNLNIQEELLSTVTKNDTSLQPGYFVFVGYVVYASLLSLIIKRIKPKVSNI
ncbi:MAG: 2-methylisocitrate lyase [Pedobacter sp.]|nr:MAG: 2-methylisocitrate lyase [Pedobacter sp.]